MRRLAAALALAAAACSSSPAAEPALDAGPDAQAATPDAPASPLDAFVSNLGATCTMNSDCNSGYRTTCVMGGPATIDRRCTFTCGTMEDVAACAMLGGTCQYPATPDAGPDAGDAAPFDADAYYQFCLPR